MMWWIDRSTTLGQISIPYNIAFAQTLTIIGLGILAICMVRFRLSKTTVNPHHPEKTTTLVTAGLYRFSRNPMYLALLLMLIAWCTKLEQLFNIPILFLFVWSMNQLQIKPEEKILRYQFGSDYEQYCARTRRWI